MDSHAGSQSQVESRVSDLLTWFTSHGGYFHPSVEFVYNHEKGVHMRVKKEISSSELTSDGRLPKGTIVVSCPQSLTFSALYNDTVDPKSELVTKSGLLIDNAYFPLPQDLVHNTQPLYVAGFGLAIQWLVGKESPWFHYLAMLPLPPASECDIPECYNYAGHPEIDIPVWWSENQTSWLKNTVLEKGLNDLIGFWQKEWDRWKDQVVPWAQAKKGVHLTWELYKYALSILVSRAFSTSEFVNPANFLFEDKLSRTVLYPVLDFLSHSPTTLNRWEFKESCFQIICDDEPRPGEEVYNSYGTKSNAQLLLTMGFIPEGLNPFDTFAIKAAIPRNFERTKEIVVERYEPNAVIPNRLTQSADKDSGTFFIRNPKLKQAFEELPQAVNDINLKHPDYFSEYCPWLAGIPISLLRFLSEQVANGRERQYIKIYTDDEASIRGIAELSEEERKRHGIKTESIFDYWKGTWNQRLRYAVTILMFGRLQHELKCVVRQSKVLEPTPDINYKRYMLASRFRKSQIAILEANLEVLKDFICTSFQNKELITLRVAVNHLSHDLKAEFLKGVESFTGGSHALSKIDDWAEDIWTFLLAFIFCSDVPYTQAPDDPKALPYLKDLYFSENPHVSWVHSFYDKDDEENSTVRQTHDNYSLILELLPEPIPDTSRWLGPGFLDVGMEENEPSFLRRCVQVVSEEMIRFEADADILAAAGEDPLEDDESPQGRQLFVFCGHLSAPGIFRDKPIPQRRPAPQTSGDFTTQTTT